MLSKTDSVLFHKNLTIIFSDGTFEKIYFEIHINNKLIIEPLSRSLFFINNSYNADSIAYVRIHNQYRYPINIDSLKVDNNHIKIFLQNKNTIEPDSILNIKIKYLSFKKSLNSGYLSLFTNDSNNQKIKIFIYRYIN